MPAEDEVDQESRDVCDVCLDEVREDQGEFACPQHWYCHPCLKEAFERAMQDMNEFPAECCLHTDMQDKLDDPALMLSLSLETEFVQQYKLKLKEHEVSPNDRVYCANTACAKFQDPEDFDKITGTNTVQCACGTLTCISCKAEHLPEHTCTTPTRPELPPYSKDLRVKERPTCLQPIELRDACNHMNCSACRHEFCFICLLPWHGSHDCPYYGEVIEGHDDDGFERTERGLHVRTGLNRQGMNRLGKHFTDPDRNVTSADRTAGLDMFENFTEVNLVVEELAWLSQITQSMQLLEADATLIQGWLTEERTTQEQAPPPPVVLQQGRPPAMPIVLAIPAMRRVTEIEEEHRARQTHIDGRVIIMLVADMVYTNVSNLFRDSIQQSPLTDERRAEYRTRLNSQQQLMRGIMDQLSEIETDLRIEIIGDAFAEFAVQQARVEQEVRAGLRAMPLQPGADLLDEVDEVDDIGVFGLFEQ